jgi:flavin reductase (DIM6/NTAB) family NADH-FMN oxidoreductase RutF
MGSFATGVTVITVADGDGARGMTANAFMSGSLEPPLCVVSIARRAYMHELLAGAERFGVSILSEQQEALSDHFGGRPDPTVAIAFERIAGVPLIRNAAAHVAAEVTAQHPCGDHTIFIGRILHLEATGRPPLIYHSGRYATLDRTRPEHDVAVPEFW